MTARLLRAFVLLASSLLAQDAGRGTQQLSTPRAWDDQAVSNMELPLAGLGQPVRHVSAEYYYSIPVRPVYKTYPVYHPDREPAGYWSWCEQQEPQLVSEPQKLQTAEDCAAAGELIFKGAGDRAGDLKNVRDSKWYAELGIRLTADGIDPSARYIVLRKGQVQV